RCRSGPRSITRRSRRRCRARRGRHTRRSAFHSTGSPLRTTDPRSRPRSTALGIAATCRIQRAGAPNPPPAPAPTPPPPEDAIPNNYNGVVRTAGSKALTRLSTDGSEGNYYDAATIAWSPDSKKIAVYKVRPGFKREVHYVESSPEDQLQPKHSTLIYAKPGDVLDVDQPVLLVVD